MKKNELIESLKNLNTAKYNPLNYTIRIRIIKSQMHFLFKTYNKLSLNINDKP